MNVLLVGIISDQKNDYQPPGGLTAESVSPPANDISAQPPGLKISAVCPGLDRGPPAISRLSEKTRQSCSCSSECLASNQQIQL
jgi:hypothetical protein